MIAHWSSEELEKVRKLADEGKSASQIAAFLPDRTRNSVIGICRRKHIALAGPRNSGNSGTVKRLAAKRSKFPPRSLRIVSPPEKKVARKYEELPMPYKPGNKTLLTVGFFDCRAILGATNAQHTVYCGGIVVPGKSWCAHHFALYTVPNSSQPKRDSQNGTNQSFKRN